MKIKGLAKAETIIINTYVLDIQKDLFIIEKITNIDEEGWASYSINVLSREKTSKELAEYLYLEGCEFWTESQALTIECITKENQKKAFKKLLADLQEM